jgi:cell division septum initiation protein DivIVA
VIVQLPLVSVPGSRNDNDSVPLHQPFKRALRGFNRKQVLRHLESLGDRIAMVAADRDAALTQVAELSKVLNHLRVESELLEHLRRETDKAKSQVEHLLATPMAEASARIQRIMRLAEEEAAETKTRAEEEAAEIKARAEAEIAARIARADQDIANLKTRADDQITGLRARASREAQSLLEHARRQCDQLETESATRRETAEHAAVEAITQREAEANARIRNCELRSISRLHLMLRTVGEQLNTRACVVERDESALLELRTQVASEVTGLETSRTEISAVLAATHQLLAEVLGQIRMVPDDRATVEASEVPTPIQHPVPTQRTVEGGTVHLLNVGTEDRRSPRAPH